ncbi:aspartic proteinase CDR1-like [Cicer arietinum]|uniref:Aspartic proteinase CDR1-like n=1 Tax=Cicer arietinum TaxID=3827 RepID=A0A1S2XHZ3_CICAR|nr:aspartic proteinase CDR1-like [Cicer arietinum]
MVYPQTLVHPCFAIIFMLFIQFHLFTNIEAQNGGFSVKLIRKNSSHVSYNPNTAESPVSAYKSEYQMELSIGTPPTKIYAEVDTGSDLIWFQCAPCPNCYQQINPLFDPQSSSTYTNIPCGSDSCSKLGSTTCSPDQLNCIYTYSYADDSTTQGSLAQETFTLNSNTGAPVSFPGITFGCGHNDNGLFNEREMGLIGLGRGSVSLISQIGSSIGGNFFSQCLVPFNTDPSVTSTMSFGTGSEVTGDGVVSTSMFTIDEFPTQYFSILLGISVEDVNIPFNNDPSIEITSGNMMIDSGTPVTYLPEEFYNKVLSEVKNKISMQPAPGSMYLDLCYGTPNLEGPTITAHFQGGDVVLTPTQTFIPLEDGLFCFGFAATNTVYGVYGNYAQSNYLIGFDLDKQLISFKPTDCTKF